MNLNEFNLGINKYRYNQGKIGTILLDLNIFKEFLKNSFNVKGIFTDNKNNKEFIIIENSIYFYEDGTIISDNDNILKKIEEVLKMELNFIEIIEDISIKYQIILFNMEEKDFKHCKEDCLYNDHCRCVFECNEFMLRNMCNDFGLNWSIQAEEDFIG